MDALKQRLQKASEKPVVIATQQPPKPGHNAFMFKGVEGFSPLGKHLPKTWNDASELPKIPIYTVSTMTSSKIVLIGQTMIENLVGSNASNDLVDMMLYLAVSLRDPGDTTKAFLDAPDTAIGKRTNLAEPNANDTLLKRLKEIRNKNRRGSTSTPAEPETVNAVVGDEDSIDAPDTAIGKRTNLAEPNANDTKAALLKRLEEIRNKNRRGSTSTPAEPETVNAVVRDEDSIDDCASAYCYIAAYLMRLHACQSDSFIKSIKRMQERFKGWYAAGHNVIDSFQLEESMANSIKQAFVRRSEVISTWVMWVAYNENEREMGKKNKELMEYLSGQVFQYRGMHAVTLTMAIQQVTKCDMGFLLGELTCPITRQAVQAIDHLLENHELVKEKPGRKTYFRYARVWDSDYFLELQSKKCPQLVYVVAKTLKNVSPTGASSDPTQIYCIKNMGQVMKEFLDGVADRLSELLMQRKVKPASSLSKSK